MATGDLAMITSSLITNRSSHHRISSGNGSRNG
jgi:hypothetical protein